MSNISQAGHIENSIYYMAIDSTTTTNFMYITTSVVTVEIEIVLSGFDGYTQATAILCYYSDITKMYPAQWVTV